MAWSARKFFGNLAAKSTGGSPNSEKRIKSHYDSTFGKGSSSNRTARGTGAITLLQSQAAEIDILLPAIDTPQSSWVRSFAFILKGSKAGLLIQFKSGATCFYPHTDPQNYYEMQQAASKGEFVHEEFYEKDYELI